MERFWNSEIMIWLQGAVDDSRTAAPDPIWLFVGVFAAGFLWIAMQPGANTEREYHLPGSHYLGKITRKFLQSEEQKAKVRELRKSRDQRLD